MWIPEYLTDVDQFTDTLLIWIHCGLYGVLFEKRIVVKWTSELRCLLRGYGGS